jgi:hypothetical protein
MVVGAAKVHVLKGLPDQQLSDGELIDLNILNAVGKKPTDT